MSQKLTGISKNKRGKRPGCPLGCDIFFRTAEERTLHHAEVHANLQKNPENMAQANKAHRLSAQFLVDGVNGGFFRG